MRKNQVISIMRLTILISLLIILITLNSSFTVSSTINLNSNYSQSASFYFPSYTRFEVQLTLKKVPFFINETIEFSLSLTPHIQTRSDFDSSNITLERVVIGDITLDLYEEDKDTLSASVPFFYCNIRGGIEPLVIPYGNTTLITGNFTFPEWWKTETVELGFYLGFSEELIIIDYGEHSTSKALHSPKLFGPLAVERIPVRLADRISFGQLELLIVSLVVITIITNRRKKNRKRV